MITTTVRGLAVAAAILIAVAASCQDSPVSSMAAVDPPTVKIGDLFTFTMTVTAPADTPLGLPGSDADLGEIEVRGFTAVEGTDDDGCRVATLTWECQLFVMDETEITPPAVTWKDEDGAAHEAQAQPVPIMVTTVLPADAQDIKDIRGPRKMPLSPWYYVAYALAALLLLALIGLALWLLLRRRKQAEQAAPPLPAHSQALLALEELEKRELVAHGQFEEYYVTLSYIARRYLEHRYAIDALESTTFMLAVEIHRAQHVPKIAEDFIEMLRMADLVKFAKFAPEDRAADMHLTGTRKLVQLTAAEDEEEPEQPIAAQG